MVVNISSQDALGSMGIFLLVAISRLGLNTLYALKQEAGLEPGSIRAAIGQLENLGLVVRSDGEKRGRRPMKLTAEGERFLVAHWMNSLDSRRDMETVLRSATIALAMADVSIASGFLLEAASERVKRGAWNAANGASSEGGPTLFHSRARLVYEDRRRRMEADLLQEIGMGLGK